MDKFKETIFKIKFRKDTFYIKQIVMAYCENILDKIIKEISNYDKEQLGSSDNIPDIIQSYKLLFEYEDIVISVKPNLPPKIATRQYTTLPPKCDCNPPIPLHGEVLKYTHSFPVEKGIEFLEKIISEIKHIVNPEYDTIVKFHISSNDLEFEYTNWCENDIEHVNKKRNEILFHFKTNVGEIIKCLKDDSRLENTIRQYWTKRYKVLYKQSF